MLHLTELGADLAEKVLQYWMDKIHRTVTNYQVTNILYTWGTQLYVGQEL